MSKRFEALGWHVQHVKDGNTDLSALRSAIEAAKKDPRPSMIKVCCYLSWDSTLLSTGLCTPHMSGPVIICSAIEAAKKDSPGPP